ncbi:MAG: PIG-L family deacetylase [Acidimicrobiia bacterium]|nr:PIG-L family deacetylase [Acidimicrobiia bacterium]
MSGPAERPASALAIGAHPDDIEFGCGATLARWAAAGTVVHLLVLTNGSKGTWDVEADPAALVATRRQEQAAAAAALGATGTVEVGDVEDGELQATVDQRTAVAGWIRRLQPELVLGHDPWKRYRLHPDHRHAGWLTVDGCVAARDAHFRVPDPNTGEPIDHHRPAALWLFEADEPDHAEPAGEWLDTKVEALLAHRSQWRSTMDIAGEDDTAGIDRFRAQVREALVDGAEVFKVMEL